MSTIKIKRSGTGGQAPTAENLAYGELALNYADGKLFYKDATNAIAEIGAGGGSGGGLDSADVVDLTQTGIEVDTFGTSSSDVQAKFAGSVMPDNNSGIVAAFYNKTDSKLYVAFAHDGDPVGPAAMIASRGLDFDISKFSFVATMQGTGATYTPQIYKSTVAFTQVPKNYLYTRSSDGRYDAHGSASGLDANTDTIAIGSGAAANVNAVAIGVNTNATDNNAIAIGNGASGNASHAIAIGLDAYAYNYGIAIGKEANGGLSGSSAVVVGQEAGGQNIGFRSVAIGYRSGGRVNGSYSPKHETTHVGGYAGYDNPAPYSTSVGANSGQTGQGTEAVAIGRYAGNTSQGTNAVAVGSWAAQNSQPANSIAISAIGNTPTGVAPPDGQYGIKIQTSDTGSLTYDTTNDWVFGAPVTSSEFKFTDGTSMTTAPTGGAGGGLDSAGVQSVLGGLESIIIGLGASETVTSASGAQIAIGEGAGAVQNSIALGANAFAYQNGVAIGHGSHQGNNGHRAVVIGSEAGSINTGFDAVVIGYQAGGGVASGSYPSQRHRNVYVGGSAGASYPGAYSVAIGWEAGKTNHGGSSVAIGAMAGQTNQGDNNIIINATGGALDRTDNFGIDIRTSDAGSLTYSTDSDWVFGAPVTAPEFKFSDGTSMTTAPTGGGAGGGLDSAGVISTINEELKIDTNQVEIGSGASVTNSAAIAIGKNALSRWAYSIAIGEGAEASYNSKSADIALGFNAEAVGGESIALGRDTIANQINSIAIGNDAQAQGTSSVAIGPNAKASLFSSYSIVIGENTTANDDKMILMNASGSISTVSGTHGIDIRTSDSGSLTYNTTDDWKFGAQVSAPELTVDAATSDWKFSVSGDDLIISFGGTSKAKLDTAGNLTVVGDVTAFGTI